MSLTLLYLVIIELGIGIGGEISRFEKGNQEDVEHEKCSSCACDCRSIRRHNEEVRSMDGETRHLELFTVDSSNRDSQDFDYKYLITKG